jgi:hypothetical protein
VKTRQQLHHSAAVLEDDIARLARTLADKRAQLRTIEVNLADPELPDE